MSENRRQDLLYPPGPETHREQDQEHRRQEAVAATSVARLSARFWPLRHDEEALLRELRKLPPIAWRDARMALFRTFGGPYLNAGTRALALCERAFGPGKVDYPGERPLAEEKVRDQVAISGAGPEPKHPRPAPVPPVPEDPEAAFEAGRVQTLYERLQRLALEDVPLQGQTVLALLDAVESHVAQAALRRLRGTLLPGQGRYGTTYYRAIEEAAGEKHLLFHSTGQRSVYERGLQKRHQDGGRPTPPLPLETRWLGHGGRLGAGVLLGSWDQSATAEAKVLRSAEAEAKLGEDHPVLRALGQGGGEPLPKEVLARMNRLLGHDFSHVRIHTDGVAVEAARLLGARALAMGTHVYFGAGQFAPGTAAGDRLLRHELMHVVQYDQGRVPGAAGGGRRVSRPTDAVEREARAAEQLSEAPVSATERGPGPVHEQENGRRPRSAAVSGAVRPSSQLLLAGQRIRQIEIRGHRITVYTDDPGDVPSARIGHAFAPGSYTAHWDGTELRVSPAPVRQTGHMEIHGAAAERIAAMARLISPDAPVPFIVHGTARRGAGAGGRSSPEEAQVPGAQAQHAPISGGPAGSPRTPTSTIPAIRVTSVEQIRRLRSLGLLDATNADHLSQRAMAGETLSFEEAESLLMALSRHVRPQPSGSPGAQNRAQTQPWLDLARFVRENSQFLVGRSGAAEGGLTLDELRQILQEYGRYVATEGAAGAGGRNRPYDPTAAEGWNRLSEAERELWRQYTSRHGESMIAGGAGSLELTPDQLFRMALSISPDYMREGAHDALVALFHDRAFWDGIFAGVAIYILMWAAPEPIISKSAAIAITLALLAVFAAAEIHHLAAAWMNLRHATESVTTIDQLEAAARDFGGAIGGTGARVLVTLAMTLAGRLLPAPRPVSGGIPPGGPPPAVATGMGTMAWAEAPAAIQVLANGTVVVVAAPSVAGTIHQAEMSGGEGGGSGGEAPAEEQGRVSDEQTSSPGAREGERASGGTESAARRPPGRYPVSDWTQDQDIASLISRHGTRHQGRFPDRSPSGSREVLYRQTEDGNVTAYMVYDEAGLPVKRVDVAPHSAPHAGIPPPHVVDFVDNVAPNGQSFRRSGETRPARPEEWQHLRGDL